MTNPDDLDDPERPSPAPRRVLGWHSIPGFFDFEDCYRDAVRFAPRGAALVEIGSFLGRSIAMLARYAIDTLRDDIKIYAVDPWGPWCPEEEPGRSVVLARGGTIFPAFLSLMHEHAPEELERITVLRMPSLEAAAFFRRPEAPRVSFAFIDAEHSYQHVLNDIDAWSKVVIPGGVLAGHDYTSEFPGVVQAVHERFGPETSRRGNSWWKVLP